MFWIGLPTKYSSQPIDSKKEKVICIFSIRELEDEEREKSDIKLILANPETLIGKYALKKNE